MTVFRRQPDVNYNSDEQGARETVQAIEEMGGEAFTVGGIVSSATGVERMIARTLDRFGRLDALVKNAGVQAWKPLLDLS